MTTQQPYASSRFGYEIGARPHLGGSYPVDTNTFMPDVWLRLLPLVTEHNNDASVLDIGCGHGAAVEWFLKRGTRCLGVEGEQAAIQNSRVREHIVVHDYTDGPFIPCVPFSLAWSAEFLEHVDAFHMPSYMVTFQACAYACITHGEPGQLGHHHVTLLEDDAWIENFAKYGFEHVPEVTAWLRATDMGGAWGRRTLMFFRRTGPCSVPP